MMLTLKNNSVILLALLSGSAIFISGCERQNSQIVPVEKKQKNDPTEFVIDFPSARPKSISAKAWYQTLNSYACTRVDNRRGGSRQIGIKAVQLPILRISDSAYSTKAFRDFFLDKKYYPELAPCIWTLTNVSFSIDANGVKAEAFSPKDGINFQDSAYDLRCGVVVQSADKHTACKLNDFSRLDPSAEFMVHILIRSE
jgi:hypothetical protein